MSSQDTNSSFSSMMTLEDAEKEIATLRLQLSELQAQNRAMWRLLTEIIRKLQISSIAIKAAASSLLEHDIFWDGSNQHAFLEAIDDSVDEGAKLITLLMLAFRAEANTLEVNLEPHGLPEILSAVFETITPQNPGLRFETPFPVSGKPVFVDYEYLVIGLRLLLEGLLESGVVSPQSTFQLTEFDNCWYLDICGIGTVPDPLKYLCERRFEDLTLLDHISPESVLKLFTASRIIRLQNISLDVLSVEEDKTTLRLTIPVAFTA